MIRHIKNIAMASVVATLGAVPASHAVAGSQSTEAAQSSEARIAEIQKEFSELMTEIKNYGVDKRDAKWDGMTDAARTKARKAMRMLRKQRNAAAEWFGSMKSSSTDAWDDIKTGFESAYKELKDALVDADKASSEKAS
jgi:N-methylhydantoinase B/oxoprolinase/acetone carboxylase alpha subunit